jgi:isoleucyl-tRNA synthetase
VSKYRETKDLNLAQVATEILEFWKKEKIFEKSVSVREGAETFTFYEGPPSANGTPGIHHVMARTVKDIFCRFKTLQGYQVKRKGGWDTHGLPVELQVEKELGITKDDIGKKISIEDYNKKCRETVMKYKDQWDDLTTKMGYWVDLENPYITYEKEYIESLWWILKQLYDKQLLYKGYTIQPYSPAAGTGLSSHELNLPGTYKDVKDTTIVAQFKVKRDAKSEFLWDKKIRYDNPELNDAEIYILAWTTTPWTLPSNTALAVGEKIEYSFIGTVNQYTGKPIRVILAKERKNHYFKERFPKDGEDGSVGRRSEKLIKDYKSGDKDIPWESLDKSWLGKELVGVRYEQLIPYIQPFYDADKAFQVIAGDFVTTEDGTGVVHISPTFGADDFRAAKQNGVPALTVKDEGGNEVPTVDRKGKFISQIGEGLKAGVAKYNIKTHKPLGADDFYVKNYTNEDESHPDYKNTDVIISIILKEENKAFKVEKYEHTYPHCWRTDKPVLYYPLDSWFIRTTALKDKMVALNKTINWKPESTGTGRFGNWLENLVDWNLSRSRYWGTPLPIWRTKDGKEEICIGSIEQLQTEIARAKQSGIRNPKFEILNSEFDLHRPYVDEIILVSSKGEPMYREADLIDVWFDSGAMPYAQWHFPFENKDIFEKSYPADFIAEGVDQTRGWFFTLHAIAVMLSESSDEIKAVNKKVGNGGVSFKNVISNGLVLDKSGNKMSKSKGNVVNPFDALAKYGPDVVRWYMMENAPPWDNLKFDFAGVEETQRRFFGTLINTYSFFVLYANIDGFVKDEMDNVPFDELSPLDKWIITKEQSLIEEVIAAYADFEPTKAARAIQEFVNDHLSNWYVRLNRKRFWQPASRGELSLDKKAAYETLYECLMVTAQLMAPIAPFFSEWLYKNLTDNIRQKAKQFNTPLKYESVHHTLLTKPEGNRKDVELEKSMDYAQRICSLVHSLRKNSKVKVRTPLQKALLPVLDEKFAARVRSVEAIIKAEVNVKEIQYIDDASGLLVKKVKPNFARLGKQYGPKMKEVSAVITTFTQAEIQTIEKQGKLNKEGFELVLEDVLISSEDIPGWSVASENGLTVALDITLTDELKREGIARDFVNRVQNLRKDMGLEVLDKISLEVEKNGEFVTAALVEHKAYIQTETQALSMELKEKVTDSTEVEMDEYNIKLKITVN